MDIPFISTLFSEYEGLLSLYMLIAIIGISLLGRYILSLAPGLKATSALNQQAAKEKATREHWVNNQNWNKKWGLTYQVIIFVCIIPFCITLTTQHWWEMLLDMFAILMVYDFFYYLTHRFIFHGGGPLVWAHSVHHQQKDPCRKDSSYIHPVEVAIGLFLFAGTVVLLSIGMGEFHLITLTITWVAFSEINQHNHNRMEVNHFPYKYLKHLSYMHHVHHSRFTSGNYATISLLYDWLFGTYDKGQGWGEQLKKKAS